MKFLIRKGEGEWLGKESHWAVLISKIDGFRFLFVFTDKRQRAIAGLVCSSEKWAVLDSLPPKKPRFPECHPSFPSLMLSMLNRLYSTLVDIIESCIYIGARAPSKTRSLEMVFRCLWDTHLQHLRRQICIWFLWRGKNTPIYVVTRIIQLYPSSAKAENEQMQN